MLLPTFVEFWKTESATAEFRYKAERDIQTAQVYEKICENIYKRIPLWASW